MNIQTLDKWHKTRNGFLIFALVELSLAYIFISLAINSGSLWQYIVLLFLTIGVIQNLAKLIGTFVHDNRHKKAN
jgi:hypothetical protein